MILAQLRIAIVNGIKAKLPTLKDCKPHPGRFSLAELKATAAKTPAVRVACLGISEIRPVAAGVEAVTQWAAFIITGDRPQLPRDSGALTLIAALMPFIPLNCWGLDDEVDSARQVRADNLFSREIDANGVALWAVSWRHEVTLGEVDPEALDDFMRLHGALEIAEDAPAAELEIDLPGP